jgi:dUTPase
MSKQVVKWDRLELAVKIPNWSNDKSYISIKAPCRVRIDENQKLQVPTGLAVELPEGYQIILRSVPKLAAKGIRVDNCIIHRKDDDFYLRDNKDQIYIQIYSGAAGYHDYYPGDEIARAIIVAAPHFEFIDATELEEVTEERNEELQDGIIDTMKNVMGIGKKEDEEEAAEIEKA